MLPSWLRNAPTFTRNREVEFVILALIVVLGFILTLQAICTRLQQRGEFNAICTRLQHREFNDIAEPDDHIRYSNPHNNHDGQKFKHSSQLSARSEVRRMQREGYNESHRLVPYYNKELDGWYVGKRKSYDYY